MLSFASLADLSSVLIVERKDIMLTIRRTPVMQDPYWVV